MGIRSGVALVERPFKLWRQFEKYVEIALTNIMDGLQILDRDFVMENEGLCR